MIPQFRQFSTKLISNPNDLINKNRSLPQRLLMLVFELKKEEIATKRALEARWEKEPLFLLSQCMMWYSDKSVQSKITQYWPFKSTSRVQSIEASESSSDSD